MASHLVGDANPAWKGDAVGYHALHRWIQKQLGNTAGLQSLRDNYSEEIRVGKYQP